MAGPASVPGAVHAPLLQVVPCGQSLVCSQVFSQLPPTQDSPLAQELAPVHDVVDGGETELQP
jgi:hypothetical protein